MQDTVFGSLQELCRPNKDADAIAEAVAKKLADKNSTGSFSAQYARAREVELWRRELERARDRFDELAKREFSLNAMLVEWNAAYPKDDFPSKIEGFGEGQAKRGGLSIYRELRQRFDSKGQPIFTDIPTLDANGKPMVNSAGQAFAFDPPATRSIVVNGPIKVCEHFDALAEQAGKALRALPKAIWNQWIPVETMQTDGDWARWVYAVFDLAWSRPTGSTLMAKKLHWKKGSKGHDTVEVEALPRFRQQVANGGLDLGWADYPTDRWYSVLHDLAACSASVIDLLLHVADVDEPSSLIAEARQLIRWIDSNITPFDSPSSGMDGHLVRPTAQAWLRAKNLRDRFPTKTPPLPIPGGVSYTQLMAISDWCNSAIALASTKIEALSSHCGSDMTKKRRKRSRRPNHDVKPLTDRENEAVDLASKGMGPTAIGRKMGIAKSYAAMLRDRGRAKLKSIQEAVRASGNSTRPKVAMKDAQFVSDDE